MSEAWVWLKEFAEGATVPLSSDEARHAAARRLRVGDSLVVFDGRGHTAAAQIESLGKQASVVVGGVADTPRLDQAFVLASAIPKGDRLSTMLQMLTQLGLDCWQPLVFEDSAIRKLDPNGKRLTRILIESCKVSRRPWLLDVRNPCSLEEALTNRLPGAAIFFGDREGDSCGFDASSGLVVIGPEAGFSEAERQSLHRVGGLPRSLGLHNLRIETAAAAAAVAFHVACGDATFRDTNG